MTDVDGESYQDTESATKIASEITASLDDLKKINNNARLYYSSIINRHDIVDEHDSTVALHILIAEANAIVRAHCTDKDYGFINNNNILQTDLFDGVHTNEKGASKLSQNIGKALRGLGDEATTSTKSQVKGKPKFKKIETETYGQRPSAELHQTRRRSTQLGDYWPLVGQTERQPRRRQPTWRDDRQPTWQADHQQTGQDDR